MSNSVKLKSDLFFLFLIFKHKITKLIKTFENILTEMKIIFLFYFFSSIDALGYAKDRRGGQLYSKGES